VTLTFEPISTKPEQFVAKLQEIFVLVSVQNPSMIQALSRSQDFYDHRWLTLNFEPVTSVSLLSHGHACR